MCVCGKCHYPSLPNKIHSTLPLLLPYSHPSSPSPTPPPSPSPSPLPTYRYLPALCSPPRAGRCHATSGLRGSGGGRSREVVLGDCPPRVPLPCYVMRSAARRPSPWVVQTGSYRVVPRRYMVCVTPALYTGVRGV